MRETKIRFGARTWALIQEEAERDGVSASQFVREAALARAIVERQQRGEIPDVEMRPIIEDFRAHDPGQ